MPVKSFGTDGNNLVPVCGVKPLAAIVPVFTYTVHISALLKRTTTVALSPNKNLLDGVAQLRVFLNILKQKNGISDEHSHNL